MSILPVRDSADAVRRLDLAVNALPEEHKYISKTLTAIRQWIAANAAAPPPPTVTGSNAVPDTTAAATVVESPAQTTPDPCHPPPPNSRHTRPRRLSMISEITLQNLHQQLAYHQERAGLSVEITHGKKRTMVSIDRGKTYFLPESARYVEFDQMLAHYPVPVTVNGNFLP